MQREFAKLNQTQIVTGFNTLVLIIFIVFAIRTIFEVKNNLEEMKKEINEIKLDSDDNFKRSTMSLSRISQKLEDQTQKLNRFERYSTSTNKDNSHNTNITPPSPPKPIKVEKENNSDYDSALQFLLT